VIYQASVQILTLSSTVQSSSGCYCFIVDDVPAGNLPTSDVVVVMYFSVIIIYCTSRSLQEFHKTILTLCSRAVLPVVVFFYYFI
jgi:hypothetical protein